jgi:hypothetical protein
MNKKFLSLAAVGLVGSSASLIANPYPTPGTENTALYSFTATTTGDITGYFAGSTASYEETVGLSVNGGAVATFGLDDKTTSVGTAFDFGHVTAGDTLVFVLNTISLNSPPYAYSDPSLNAPYDGTATGHQHVYSFNAAANALYAGSPVGTYVGFEDLPATGSDWNYFDDTFIFTDVSTTTTTVPDSGSTMALLGMAIAGFGLLRRKA